MNQYFKNYADRVMHVPTNYRRSFWIFLAIVTVLRSIYINFPNLVPQEAYYWLYAKHLDLSYFDHPPLTAWTIAFFTHLGGDTHFFVRLGAVLYSTGASIAAYYLARSILRGPKFGFWTVITMNSALIFAIGSVIFTPDTPMIFFWTLVLISVHRAISTSQWPWWYAAGISLGLAFLSKYTSGLLVGSTFLFLLASKKHRHWLISVHPYMALVLAFIIFSPVIIWNIEHEWASFAFQSTRRVRMMGVFKPEHFFEMIGTQAAMLTPILFIGLFYSLYKLFQKWKAFHDDDILFILSYSVPPIALFSLVSLRALVKMNWLAPAYITAVIGMVYFFSEKSEDFPHIWKRWVRAGLTVGMALVLLAHLLLLAPFVPVGSGDTWSGWEKLADRVKKVKAELEGETFIFSPSYKISSELKFYGDPDDMIYAENILGKPALQFDYWLPLDDAIGKDALLVHSNSMKIRGRDRDILAKCFEHVEDCDTLTIVRNFITVRKFYLTKCFDYKGPPQSLPLESKIDDTPKDAPPAPKTP
ncbi:MAG: hypothetical protein B6244_12435 [Candidatus Cloacimonetes bacterium 4572_55]|nr:MAG: hypothetical protein B6244_12435 [Candidatus Cloacimonetes bacterium 4572_55]